jgi:hypothetical protein
VCGGGGHATTQRTHSGFLACRGRDVRCMQCMLHRPGCTQNTCARCYSARPKARTHACIRRLVLCWSDVRERARARGGGVGGWGSYACVCAKCVQGEGAHMCVCVCVCGGGGGCSTNTTAPPASRVRTIVNQCNAGGAAHSCTAPPTHMHKSRRMIEPTAGARRVWSARTDPNRS